MLRESIQKIEEILDLGDETSRSYEQLVAMADKMRMLYASHSKKRRDDLLLIIKSAMLKLIETEREILEKLLNKIEKGEK